MTKKEVLKHWQQIYWVGALGGSVLAYLVYPPLKGAIYTSKTEKKTD